jgi:hypothetical protein
MLGARLVVSSISLADERAQQTLHVGDDGVDVDDFEFEKLFAAEGQKLAGERGGAIGGLLNGFGFGVQRMAWRELVEQNLGVAADDHEQIVEVVSDAAGEAADGFHFLGLAELIFEHAALGDVFGDGFENVGGFVAAGDGAAADADGDGAPSLRFQRTSKPSMRPVRRNSSTRRVYSAGSTKTSFCGSSARTSRRSCSPAFR